MAGGQHTRDVDKGGRRHGTGGKQVNQSAAQQHTLHHSTMVQPGCWGPRGGCCAADRRHMRHPAMFVFSVDAMSFSTTCIRV